MIMKSANLLSILVSALLLAGCGADTRSETTPSGAAPTAAEAPAAEVRPIAITGNDQMKFSVTEIRAKPGEALSVTLNNIGTMPKVAMGHNWVLLKAGVDPASFNNDAVSAAATDYVPESQRQNIIAATKLLGPKESDTVTFNAPTEPGRYVFLCSFPGHFQVGMKGELIVE